MWCFDVPISYMNTFRKRRLRRNRCQAPRRFRRRRNRRWSSSWPRSRRPPLSSYQSPPWRWRRQRRLLQLLPWPRSDDSPADRDGNSTYLEYDKKNANGKAELFRKLPSIVCLSSILSVISDCFLSDKRFKNINT